MSPEGSHENGGGHVDVLVHRALIAIGIAALVAVAARIGNGNTGTPPSRGGWTELGPEDF